MNAKQTEQRQRLIRAGSFIRGGTPPHIVKRLTGVSETEARGAADRFKGEINKSATRERIVVRGE